MADKQTDEPTAEESENAFWEKFTGHLDSWWDNKMKTYENNRSSSGDNNGSSTGTSRTGVKRATLPGLIADMVFGPPKD